MADQAHHAGGAAPKGSPIVTILLALNLGLTGFVLVKILKQKPPAAAKDAKSAEKEKREEPINRPPGPIAALDPIVVNLNEPGKPRYLKATFELELEDEMAVKLLENKKRLIRDEVLRYLSSLSVAETAGEEAKTKLQAELKARVDKVLGEGNLRRIFLQEFVIQ